MNQSIPAIAYEVSQVMPLAVATGLFRSLCTIQAPSGALGPSGAPDGLYSDVSGLTNIVCQDAPQPPSEIKLGANERRAPGDVLDTAIRHVLLDTYYPAIAVGWRQGWRAVISSPDDPATITVYDIAGVESDSQVQMTRLELHLANAGEVEAALPSSGAVLAMHIEEPGQSFVPGLATSQTISGLGLGLTINILTVVDEQIETYEILDPGSGYAINNLLDVLGNASEGGATVFAVDEVTE